MLTSVRLCFIISFVRLRNTAHRGVAQVVERFVRDEEAASSSLVTPTKRTLRDQGSFCFVSYFVSYIIKKIKSWEDFACPLSLCLYSGFLLFATFQNLRFLLLLPLLSGLLWLHPNLLSALVCTACPCTLWTQSTRVLFRYDFF